MPSRPCKHPTCTAYIPAGISSRFCFEHRDQDRRPRRDRDRFYDRHIRDPEKKQFYNSAAWKTLREAVITAHPICQRCMHDWSRHVHHVIPIAKCTPAQRLDRELVRALCIPCHNIEEEIIRKQEAA